LGGGQTKVEEKKFQGGVKWPDLAKKKGVGRKEEGKAKREEKKSIANKKNKTENNTSREISE